MRKIFRNSNLSKDINFFIINFLKAFSLLELIIVMAVISVIMGISWSGIQTFRATSEMQNAYSDFVSNLKSLQNKSKNAVSSNLNGDIPDYYFIVSSNNKYSIFNCVRTSVLTSAVTCNKDSSQNIRGLTDNILISLSGNCSGLGFSKLNSKLVTLPLVQINLDSQSNFSSNIIESGKCSFTFGHRSIDTKKVIEFDLDTNTSNV